MTIAIIILSSLILLYQSQKRPAVFIYCLAWIGIVCVQALFFAMHLNDGHSCIQLVYSTLCKDEIEMATRFLAVNNVLMILFIIFLNKVRFCGAPVLGHKTNNTNHHNGHRLLIEKIYISGSLILFYILITGGTMNPLSAISAGSDTTTRNLATAATLALLPRILIYRRWFIKGATTRTENILLFLMFITSLLVSRITAVGLIGEFYIIKYATSTSLYRKHLFRQTDNHEAPKGSPSKQRSKYITSLVLWLSLAITLFMYGSYRHEHSIARFYDRAGPNSIEAIADVEKISKFGEVTYFQSVSTFAGIVAASTTDASHAHTLVASFVKNSTVGVVRNLIPSAQLKDSFSKMFNITNDYQPLTILPSLFEFFVLLIGLSSISVLNILSLTALFYLEWLLRHYFRNQRYNEAAFVPIVAVALSVSMRGSPWGVVSSTIATCLLGLAIFRLFPLYGKH